MARQSFLTTVAFLLCLLLASATNAFENRDIGDTTDTETMKKISSIKTKLSPEQRKIHSSLWADAALSKDRSLNRMLTASTKGTAYGSMADEVEINEREVQIEIRGEISKGLLKRLKFSSAKVTYVNEEFGSLVATVPGSLLQELASFPGVLTIIPLRSPVSFKADTSEGVTSHRVNFTTATGAGVKIGVLSDSVDHLTDVQTSGDLPTVMVLFDQPGESGEGTAMLEIVHDMAPNAILYFATAYPTEAAFASNIIALANAGCKVIVDDILYLLEAVYSDGPIARAVDTVTSRGVSYFSSAGNMGNTHYDTSSVYEGDYKPTTSIVNNYLDMHQFGNNNNLGIAVAPGSITIILHWADDFDNPTADYDLFVLNGTGSVIAASTSAGPVEAVDITITQNEILHILALRYDGTSRMLSVRLFPKGFGAAMSVSTNGMIYGHAGARGCFSIAAVEALGSGNNFGSQSDLEAEDFTSQGPRRVFYNGRNSVITPNVFTSKGGSLRKKPDFAAADGVSTATPGFNPFYGTSAAAPHAAALAALALSSNPKLSPRDIYYLFMGTAKDMLTKGWDDVTGHGVLDAVAILQSPCLSGPCANGGCVRTSETDFICSCDSGFIGDLCDISPASKAGWSASLVFVTMLVAAMLAL